MTLLVMQTVKTLGRILGAIVVLLLFVLFMGTNCPVQSIFGIPCPGCNMTTSLYYLIQGNIESSIYYHAMLIPTFVFGAFVLFFKWKKKQKWVERFLWMWIGCMVMYYIYRMLFIFPEIPMVFDSTSFLGRFFV